MAKAKKLPSGSWTILVYDGRDNGKIKLKRFTAETKAEVEYIAAQYRKDRKQKKKPSLPVLTVTDAIDKYIELNEAMLSPTTIDGYRKFQANSFKDIMDLPISEMDDETAQRAINSEASRISERTGQKIKPKSVKNEWGLIAAALRPYGITFNVKLPKVPRKNKVLPDPALVIAAVKDTDIELPCLLAMWLSFSMSEIRGIKCSSIRDGHIFINQVVVDVAGYPVEKESAKTDTRIRRQRAPEYILQMIAALPQYKAYKRGAGDAYIVDMTARQIGARFSRLMDAAELDITFHDLRHIFASVMLNELGIAEKIVQDEGGWSTPHVMKAVYSNTFSDSRQKADELRDAYFNQKVNTNS